MAWLEEFDLLPADTPVLDSDVARARELREALRTPGAKERRARARCDGGGPDREPGGGDGRASLSSSHPRGPPSSIRSIAAIDGSLAAVAAGAFEAMENGTWTRLRACLRCHWASYDRSRNLSSRWCSMRYCGNRTKTRAYRLRKDAAC